MQSSVQCRPCAEQCSLNTVQCSAGDDARAVQCSAVQAMVQCSAVLAMVQCSAVQCRRWCQVQCSAVQSMVQCSKVQFSTVRPALRWRMRMMRITSRMAVQCSAVHGTAGQCSSVQCTSVNRGSAVVQCSVVHGTAVHCCSAVMQCSAVYDMTETMFPHRAPPPPTRISPFLATPQSTA